MAAARGSHATTTVTPKSQPTGPGPWLGETEPRKVLKMSLIHAAIAPDDYRRCTDPCAEVRPLALAPRGDSEPERPYNCTSWTDHQLLLAVPTDRDAAYAELFRRHSPSVAAVARIVLRSSSGCDDIVAEVFTALWRAPEKFDPDRGSLSGFLRVAARGRSIDLLRNESSRFRRELQDEGAPGSHVAIEAEVIAAETRREVRQAVSQLPDGERIAIELAYFGGMTYRAVASHLGLPEGTVKSRIKSGLRRLRNQFPIEDCDSSNPSPAQADYPTPQRRELCVRE